LIVRVTQYMTGHHGVFHRVSKVWRMAIVCMVRSRVERTVAWPVAGHFWTAIDEWGKLNSASCGQWIGLQRWGLCQVCSGGFRGERVVHGGRTGYESLGT